MSFGARPIEKKYHPAQVDLFQKMLTARHNAGLSQAEVARRMGTKQTAITRLENSLKNGKSSPSLATLDKYAKAVGANLIIDLTP